MVPAAFDGIPITARRGDGPEWLYCFYSDEGLLYVGITRIGIKRFEGHQKEKAWWSYVNRIEVECFPTRDEVRIAECNAIADERPAFNIADRGPYAAQAARHAQERRRLLDELNRVRNHAISLEIENKHLRAEVGAKVIEFVPRHLRKPIAA